MPLGVTRPQADSETVQPAAPLFTYPLRYVLDRSFEIPPVPRDTSIIWCLALEGVEGPEGPGGMNAVNRTRS